MEGLIGSLNKEKWQEVSAADKAGEYIEYHVNRTHRQQDKTTWVFMVETDNIDPKKVLLEHATDDPIKNVSMVEFRLNAEGDKVTGIDLDGDVVQLQS